MNKPLTFELEGEVFEIPDRPPKAFTQFIDRKYEQLFGGGSIREASAKEGQEFHRLLLGEDLCNKVNELGYSQLETYKRFIEPIFIHWGYLPNQ